MYPVCTVGCLTCLSTSQDATLYAITSRRIGKDCEAGASQQVRRTPSPRPAGVSAPGIPRCGQDHWQPRRRVRDREPILQPKRPPDDVLVQELRSRQTPAPGSTAPRAGPRRDIARRKRHPLSSRCSGWVRRWSRTNRRVQLTYACPVRGLLWPTRSFDRSLVSSFGFAGETVARPAIGSPPDGPDSAATRHVAVRSSPDTTHQPSRPLGFVDQIARSPA